MQQSWPAPVKYPVRKVIGRVIAPLLRFLSRHFDLVHLSQQQAEAKFFQASVKEIENLLEGDRLVLFDIGARGGVENGWTKYWSLIDVTLAEPDPTEAARLEAAGYRVIPKLIGGHDGQGILNLCNKGGSSSTLEPGGPYHAFYANDAMERFQVKERIELPMTTVESVVSKQGSPFDYIKLDTQGSELEILNAIGEGLPLIIKTEISFVPLYSGSSTAFEVAQLLWSKGYALFHMTHVNKSAPAGQRGSQPFQGTLLPLHGDAWFFPDWTRPEGQNLIRGREKKYRAIMRIFAADEIAAYAAQSLDAA